MNKITHFSLLRYSPSINEKNVLIEGRGFGRWEQGSGGTSSYDISSFLEPNPFVPNPLFLIPSVSSNKKASWRLALLLATELARAYKSDLSRWARQPFADEPRFISGDSPRMTMVVLTRLSIAVLLFKWNLCILHSLGIESRQRTRETRVLSFRRQLVHRQSAI